LDPIRENIGWSRGTNKGRSLDEFIRCRIIVLTLLFSECLTKFGETTGLQLWDAVNDCFDMMPIAATIDEKVHAYLNFYVIGNSYLIYVPSHEKTCINDIKCDFLFLHTSCI